MSNVSQVVEWMTQRTKSNVIRVVIVDDNKTTVQSLSEVLTYAPKTKVVFTARSGKEFLDKMKASPAADIPDVVIMDVNMPGMNGIETVKHGLALYPGVKFIMLTVFDDEETLFEAIQAGASGYLLKDERTNVILSHIESLMEDGSAPMSPRIARKTLDLLASSDKPITGTKIVELENLSAREKDVLYLLVDGLEYRDISERLNISPHTVRKHIANIYDKLHISSKAQAIHLMQGTRLSEPIVQSGRHKILLVDDHQIVLDSLAMMMGTFPELEIVGKLNDPRDVLAFLKQHPVDLIVSDISMPHMDGLALAAQIREQLPNIKIALLTVSEDADQVKVAVSIGVEGYVLKKANKEELRAAIRTIMDGQQYFSHSILAFL